MAAVELEILQALREIKAEVTKTNKQIDLLRSDSNERFAHVINKIADTNERLDHVVRMLNGTANEVTTISAAVIKLSLETPRIDALDRRMLALEQKLNG